jgi:hypothetical protein
LVPGWGIAGDVGTGLAADLEARLERGLCSTFLRNERKRYGGGTVSEPDVYQTESGTIFRVSRTDGGGLSVQLLKSAIWETGPIGMTGLRRARGTTHLTKRQVESLPE